MTSPEVSLTGALLALTWTVICGSALVGWALTRLVAAVAWRLVCAAITAFASLALLALFGG